MMKLIVALALCMALLAGLSPWPGLAVGLDGGLLGIIGVALGLLLLGGTVALLLGGTLLLVIGLPVLLVIGVLAVVAAPLLIPLLVIGALVGLVVKGMAACVPL